MTDNERMNRIVDMLNSISAKIRPSTAVTLKELDAERSRDTWQNRICGRLMERAIEFARQLDDKKGN